MSGSKKMLDPALLADAAGWISKLADDEYVGIALTGDFALQHYGMRCLPDSVAVIAPSEGLLRATTIHRWTCSCRITAPNGVPVDIIVRDDVYAPLYEEARVQAVDKGAPLLVARAEHIAAMKMAAGQRKDIADLESLVVEKVIDLQATKHIIGRYMGVYAAEKFDSFVEETLWRASKGRT